MKAREARKNQVAHGHQGDEAPAEDRPARLRDQEGSRRPVPQAGRQGQDHDHVPRSRAVPARARLPAPAAARRGRAGARLRRVRAEAGRPQHDHGARPAQEEGRGPRRGARPTRPAATRPSAADAPTSPPPRPADRRRRDRDRRDPPLRRPTRRRPSPPSSRPEHHRTSPRPPPAASSPSTTRAPREHTEENDAMPKNKTHSGTKKRFHLTGTGKVMREQANRRHLLEHKSVDADPPAGGRRRHLEGGRQEGQEACSASKPRRPSRPSTRQIQGVITWHA